jgi:hypothetical protein
MPGRHRPRAALAMSPDAAAAVLDEGAMAALGHVCDLAPGPVLDDFTVERARELLPARAGRIRAIVDVTGPEVLPPGHPLWDCANVLITPQLAGSQGTEWGRPANLAVAEIGRWTTGEGFAYPVRRETLERQA